jgi:hypothetical protein
LTFGVPIPLGGVLERNDMAVPGASLAGSAAIAALEQSLREKDDIIAAQYAELTEARRQLELLREAVEHWKAKAA